jgi:hypothetical protein
MSQSKMHGNTLFEKQHLCKRLTRNNFLLQAAAEFFFTLISQWGGTKAFSKKPGELKILQNGLELWTRDRLMQKGN